MWQNKLREQWMPTKLTEQELDLRLTHMDGEFTAQGLPLRFRPLQSFKSLYGAVPDGPIRNVLFDQIMAWFFNRHGERMKWDGVIGRIPVILRDDLYLVRVMLLTEDIAVEFTSRFEGLPEDIAKSLTREEFESLGRKVSGATTAFQKLYALTVDDNFLDDVERAMVWRACFDLENAAHCLKMSGDTQTAIFHTHAAAEKFLKVALKRSGSNLDLKSLGHNIPKIFGALAKSDPRFCWLQSSVDSLHALAPNMQIRYQIVPRTIEDSISAFLSALHVCGILAQIWMFDAERGTKHSTFEPERFYLDGRRWTYYCREIQNGSEKPLAVLTLFRYEPLLGWSFLMDITVGLDQSALYLEVKDSTTLAILLQQYEAQLRNPGKKVMPEELGIEIASGPEGSYTTGSFLVERSKIKL
jgi:hypothetical protein